VTQNGHKVSRLNDAWSSELNLDQIGEVIILLKSRSMGSVKSPTGQDPFTILQKLMQAMLYSMMLESNKP